VKHILTSESDSMPVRAFRPRRPL